MKLLIFAGARYYPSGGVEDFFGFAETTEEALELLLIKGRDNDWWQIVDRESMKVVKQGNNGLYGQ
jgi:hypothetical protein